MNIRDFDTLVSLVKSNLFHGQGSVVSHIICGISSFEIEVDNCYKMLEERCCKLCSRKEVKGEIPWTVKYCQMGEQCT